MTRNEIITELYESRDFNNCIAKMKPEHLQDELKAEVMLILCEKDETLIKALHQKGDLRFYTVRIILNLIQSNTSPFYKKFRTEHLDISVFGDGCPSNNDRPGLLSGYHELSNYHKSNSDERDAEVIALKQLQEAALSEIDNLYWYDREIVNLYLKLGNYRAVERETGIPWESVYKTVQRSCKKIRERVA